MSEEIKQDAIDRIGLARPQIGAAHRAMLEADIALNSSEIDKADQGLLEAELRIGRAREALKPPAPAAEALQKWRAGQAYPDGRFSKI